MICSNCGKENPDGNWVCGSCGEPLGASGASPDQSDLPYGDSLPQAAAEPAKKAPKSRSIVILLIAVMVAAIVALPAWYYLHRSPDQSTPTGTVEAYVNAISDKDCDKLFSLVSDDSISQMGGEAMDACSSVLSALNFSVSDFEALDEQIDGDTATVRFKATMAIGNQSMTQTTTATLIKVDGDWKVDSGLS